MGAFPLTVGGEAGIFGLERRLGRRRRDEPLAVSSEGLCDLPGVCFSSGTSKRRCRREAERVTGAKYPSCASDLSEREGDGDTTRGVSGTTVGVEGILSASSENG